MKQTAVEFLIKEFSDILGPLDTKPMQDLLMMDAMKRAKEMEKEQMRNAVLDDVADNENMKKKFADRFEKHYNETYNK